MKKTAEAKRIYHVYEIDREATMIVLRSGEREIAGERRGFKKKKLGGFGLGLTLVLRPLDSFFFFFVVEI